MMTIRTVVLIFICCITASSSQAQSYLEKITSYRNKKHSNYASNPYSPLSKEQVKLLDYYPTNEHYRIEASVEILSGEKPFLMPTYDGTSNAYRRYAVLHFTLDGQQHTLTIYQSVKNINLPIPSDHLFLPFLDQTSGKSSYGGGRYIDLNKADIRNGKIWIDFNTCYNPYCAYSAGYRCPEPPKENHLNIPILAGEKNYTLHKNDRKVNKDAAKDFSDKEIELIVTGNGPMHVLQVTDAAEMNILREPSEDINPKTAQLKQLKERMYLTVRDENHPGVGIAAPQVGINKNLIWVQRFDKPNQPFEFYINPKIIWRSKLIRTGLEGCLSIPDRKENIARSYAIRLQYWTEEEEIVEENIEGFTAVIFQHEVDHLYGILYPDRLEEQEGQKTTPLKDKIDFAIPQNTIVP